MNTGPRRLTRSRSDRMVSGVCGGLAQYLNLDATIVRLLAAAAILFTGVGLIAYIVAWIVIPEEGAESSIANRQFAAYRGQGAEKSPLDDIYQERPGTNAENIRREYKGPGV